MSLATLFKVPETPQEIEEFTHSNFAEHIEINAAILRKTGKTLTPFPIQSLVDPNFWLIAHDTWHTEINAALGTANNDLMELDLDNRDQAANWFWLHSQEHREWRLKLGI